AVDQGLPVLGLVQHLALYMASDVPGDESSAQLLGFEWTDLFVERADPNAFFVVQAGPVHGVGKMVERKLAFATRIDDGTEFLNAGQGFSGRGTNDTHLSNGRKVGHRLLRMI